ncbi:MAG: glycosyltransferase family 2 protein [Thaumarchaeota archaeon]|nr:glycosyltransferase family 2 protein [Nitrososphaerota archaeon]
MIGTSERQQKNGQALADSEKISIIMPVFRESACLEGLLSHLIRDSYATKEILVVVDEPTEYTMKLVKRFEKDVNFIINMKRKGKVGALNSTVHISSGQILLFLDSDNVITSNSVLMQVVAGMRGRDIVEFQLDALGNSFIAKLVGIEFANANLTNMLYSRYSARKPIIGGAAFAIRREAFFEIGGFRNFITEDLDLGWRAFEKRKSYSHLDGVKIYTAVPTDLRSWISQRKRWSTGGAEWFSRNYRSIVTGTLKNMMSITIPSFLILFPTAVLGIINLILPGSIAEKVTVLMLLLLPFKAPQSGPAVFLLFSIMSIVRDFLSYGVGFAVSLLLTYAACRYTGRRFNIWEFAVYYFAYSPMTLLMFAYGLVRVVILRNLRLTDWKV